MELPHKRTDANEDGGADSWIMSYGDMMTLLLTFFVLIVSFSTVELIKFRKFMGALRGASGAMVQEEGNAVVQILPTTKAKDALPNEELQQLFQEIEELVMTVGDGNNISINVTAKGIRFRIASLVMFESGQARLKPESLKLLDGIARIVRRLNFDVAIEGHTDNIPIHNVFFPSNWELSAYRAVSVLRYFVENQNLNPRKVTAIGYGEYYPVASNDIPSERAQNRRVEISLNWPEMTGKELLESRKKE